MQIMVNTGRKDTLMEVCSVKESNFAVIRRFVKIAERPFIPGDILTLDTIDVSNDFYMVSDCNGAFVGYVQSAMVVTPENEEAFIAPVRYIRHAKEPKVSKVEPVSVSSDTESPVFNVNINWLGLDSGGKKD